MDEPALLHGFLARAARRHPERVAIDVPPGPDRRERQCVTYAELDARSDAIAAALAPFVSGECLVALFLPRTDPDLFAAQLGVLRAGAAFVCLDAAFPDDHLRAVLADAAPVALLSADPRAARLFDGPVVDPAHTEPASAPAPPHFEPDRLAYVIYTSGTTGAPKGVMIEHRGISNLVGDDLAHFRLTPDDRVAQGSSAAYDSSLEETWLAFAAGATLVVMDDHAARLGPDLVPWLQRERVTVLCPPPTLLRATGCTDPHSALPDVSLLYVGGEALPQDLADRWARGRRMENGYGPTECTVTITRARVRPGAPVSIGQPVRGHRAFVLDDALRPVPDGETGELCLQGPGLARGYRGRPELTAERFPVHEELGRIYRTGDLVRRDPATGDLFYLGRLDAQVKLRGYRIELPAVEAQLAGQPGVRAAACRVQDRALVAFVVPENAAAPPAPDALEAALRQALPAYMVPARYGVLPDLPTTVGGKLDRARLPDLAAPARADTAAPRTETEARVAEAVADTLGLKTVSIHDDFFLDLGGDSLAAAGVVSALRARGFVVAVRDLYEARTVAALARRTTRSKQGGRGGSARPLPRTGPATAFQVAVLLFGLVAGSAVAYVLGFLVLPWLLLALGIPLFLALLPFVGLVLAVLWLPFAVGLAALLKTVLIGRYRPGRWPVWSGYFLRHWLVRGAAGVIPWGLLQGTVFLNWALRTLGARIGRRVHIDRGVDLGAGGWDLLDIGDDATVRRDASLRLVELDAGDVVVGPVSVGARATVDVRAGVSGGASVGAEGLLTALSWLPAGARVPDGERWDGIPAAPAGQAPAPPHVPPGLSPAWHGVLTILGRFATAYVGALPFLALLWGMAVVYDVDAAYALDWLFAPTLAGCLPLFVLVVVGAVLGLLVGVLGMRALGRVRPGTVSRWSLSYLRVQLKTAGLEGAGRWLSGTLMWPVWLRLAGMRVGRGCEVSSIADTVPELLSIGEQSFLADGIYLGGPRVHRGAVTVDETALGRDTFLGNHVVVPAGHRLPDDLFVGVCTVTDDAAARPGSAWFGLPPFSLPRREVVQADRRVTHEPSLVRRVTRWSFELARFLLPAFGLALFLGWFKGVAALGWLATPVVSLAAALAAVLFIVALKWALIGRVRPGQHPLWSCWCSRWDFLYVAWGMFARGVLTALDGTLLLGWTLRAFGVRIGRAVVLGRGFAQVVDPDMLAFEDGATVASMFQAHSFEDRVLKIDRVRIRAGATVRAGAVLFYGADVGARATVSPHGVVMKRERLADDATYEGCPV